MSCSHTPPSQATEVTRNVLSVISAGGSGLGKAAKHISVYWQMLSPYGRIGSIGAPIFNIATSENRSRAAYSAAFGWAFGRVGTVLGGALGGLASLGAGTFFGAAGGAALGSWLGGVLGGYIYDGLARNLDWGNSQGGCGGEGTLAPNDPVSPLILDLDGDGVEADRMSLFDHAGDGWAEATRWAGKDDGTLVWDRNGDGKINDGSELFGNNSVLGNGNNAAHGFAALAEFDKNGDGVIDSRDTGRDTNNDGVVDGKDRNWENLRVLRRVVFFMVCRALPDKGGGRPYRALVIN